MKKNFKFLTASAALLASVAALASCGGSNDNGGGSTTTDNYGGELVFSGPLAQKDWIETIFAKYNAERKEAGSPEIKFKFVEHGEDKVDSEVLDWKTGPDVYTFASDKILPLYQAGALATVSGSFKENLKNTLTDASYQAVQFAGKTVAYPVQGDNTYFLYYDKSAVTLEECATIEGLLEKAKELGRKVSYNMNEAFYGGAALTSFGAGWQLTLNDAGQVAKITADFNTEKGLKAGKAIYKIMTHEAHQGKQAAPNAENGLIACVDGTWNASAYKEALGENFACTKLPTVTVDGETTNLNSFLGYKMVGVNPQVSSGNNDRLLAAHNFATYLTTEAVQLSKFEAFVAGPTNKAAMNNEKVKTNEAMAAVSTQTPYTVAQTALPGNIWTAPAAFTQGIIDGTITLENMPEYLETLNTQIINSK